MKRIIILALVLISFAAQSSNGQKILRSMSNTAFKPGEKLKFRIHYGFVDAGEATLEVDQNFTNLGGRDCYHVIGTGQSVGAFDWFFEVRDRYESIIDKQALIPWMFIRRVNEGGYIINQNVSFNHFRDSASSEKKTIAIPEYTQDLISAFYYARNLDFATAKEGDIFPINGYLDDGIIPLNLKYIGKEDIKYKKGVFHCLKFHPVLQEGRVFRTKEDMTVWISDDKNRIPVRVESEILVGSIKMDLMDYENLNNEPAFVKK
ncbi:MAG: DUF3108 domain-containing protein [Bacteroidetes bacterium]|nr:DUF3108 domain-containing protein [Bacteroidota bacterium]